MWGDPISFAGALGIRVCSEKDLPFDVGSTREVVIYRWDEDQQVRRERVWRGMAQCIMTRAGVPWGDGEASTFAKKLLAIDSEEKPRFIA